MRITDILTESQQREVTEAPQGMFKRAGLGIASKLGSQKATGKLQSGDLANTLNKEYMRFVGQTASKFGNKPTEETLYAFLQKKGYPTQAVKQLIDKEMAAIQAKADAKAAKKNPVAPEGPGTDAQAEPAAEPDAAQPEAPTPNGFAPKTAKVTRPATNSKPRVKAKAGADLSQVVSGMYAEGVIPGNILNKAMMLLASEVAAAGMDPSLGGPTKDDPAAQGGAGGGQQGSAGQQGGAQQGGAGGGEGGEKIKGTLNYTALGKYFPGIDATQLRKAMSNALAGKPLNVQQNQVMAQAMAQLVKLDPKQTVEVMNLFKRVKAEPAQGSGGAGGGLNI